MNDRITIQELAKKYAELAALDIQKENAEMYRALNRLKPIRPVVLIDELPWSQLAGSGELKLVCSDEKHRRVERFFRSQLYRWNHFRCDMILVNHFPWPRHINIGSFGIDIKENILAIDEGNSIVSHGYQDQIKTQEDIARLRVPKITTDEQADMHDREWLEGLLGGILPVVQTGLEYMGFYHPWDDIARWRGVEPLLWDLADRPEFMHSLVRRLTDIRIKMLDNAEELGLLEASSPYLHSTAGLTDDLPGEIEGSLKRSNIWGRGTAQIFSTVSPAMLEEFEIDYVKEYFDGFGLLYYGCCEPLHKRIGILRTLPRLRKISITPWADVDVAADNMGSEFVMSNKPNPSLLAVGKLDEEAVKKETLHALKACRRNNTPVEFTLKDISSAGNNPENLDRWAKVVMETVLGF